MRARLRQEWSPARVMAPAGLIPMRVNDVI